MANINVDNGGVSLSLRIKISKWRIPA